MLSEHVRYESHRREVERVGKSTGKGTKCESERITTLKWRLRMDIEQGARRKAHLNLGQALYPIRRILVGGHKLFCPPHTARNLSLEKLTLFFVRSALSASSRVGTGRTVMGNRRCSLFLFLFFPPVI